MARRLAARGGKSSRWDETVPIGSMFDILDANGYLVADGAMGTQLFAVGLTAGDPPELWVVDHAEKVKQIHRSYAEAGSDLVLTNTFGGNRFRLSLHGLDDRVEELNEVAAMIAREIADEFDRPIGVAGSMGPTGELLEPLGNMSIADCRDAFAEQARGLAAGGADVLWIETMSDLDEAEAAVDGARSVSDLPVAVTMSFDTAGRTMMGVTGEEMGRRLSGLDLFAMGANCGNNLADTEAAMTAIRSATPEVTLICKANAGIPEWSGDSLVYDASPEALAAHGHRLREAGVSIIGGCCGSTPAHIALLSAVLRGDEPVPDVPITGPPATAPVEDRMAHRRTRRRPRRP
jgi:methionine synthase I (cobalamin-dependent)